MSVCLGVASSYHRAVKRPATGHSGSEQKQMQLEKNLSWVYTYNFIMRKAETGGLKVQRQPELHRAAETLSKKKICFGAEVLSLWTSIDMNSNSRES